MMFFFFMPSGGLSRIYVPMAHDALAVGNSSVAGDDDAAAADIF
jgi:hypothetical protein